jgi:hypothetical protein
MAKKRKSEKAVPVMSITIYGIWSKEQKKIIFVGLDKEEVEIEYDMEGYPEETHRIFSMETYYDISNLE